MALNSPKDGAAGTTEQSPQWEGPQVNKPRGYMPAKDNPDSDRDAVGESLQEPKKQNVSDAFKTKENSDGPVRE